MLDSLKNLDACLHYPVAIRFDIISKSIIQKHLSVQEAAIVEIIAEHLCAWNYYIGTLKDFYSVVSSSNLSKVFQALEEKSAIHVLHKNKPFKYDIVIKLNPLMAWKGTFKYREQAINNWYAPKRNGIRLDLPEEGMNTGLFE